jgi:hypothetical protein
VNEPLLIMPHKENGNKLEPNQTAVGDAGSNTLAVLRHSVSIAPLFFGQRKLCTVSPVPVRRFGRRRFCGPI